MATTLPDQPAAAQTSDGPVLSVRDLTVLAVNFIGDGLRDAFDPRSRA